MKNSIKKLIPLKSKIKESQFFKDTFRAVKLKKYLAFPLQVQIESTSLCNARCTHCENRDLERPHAHMEMGLYKKIIDEISQYKKYCELITFSFIGEPLLDPNFFEKVKYAKQKNICMVSTYCNGSLLTPDNCQKIIDSGLDRIIFGTDGATKESYEAVREGLSYPKVVEGVKRLIDLRRKLNVQYPRIEVQMVLTPTNKNEQELFKKTWKNIADRCFFRELHIWGGKTIKKEMIQHSHQLIKDWRPSSVPCFYLWKSIVIAESGKVALCCIDSHVKEEIGDLTKQSIYDVWHGKRLNEFRRLHLAGRMEEASLCQQCNFRQIKEYPWWWYGK